MVRRLVHVVAWLIALTMPLAAEGVGPGGLDTDPTPVVAWVSRLPHAAANTLDRYEAPDDVASGFRTLLALMVRADWARAREAATRISYRLVALRHDDRWVVAAVDGSGKGLWPTVLVHEAPVADIVLQAPHPDFEPGTAEEAALLLVRLRARAAIIGGAHRCASRHLTACDGKTDVCGKGGRYRDSDAGHSTGTLYHAAHVAFAEAWRGSLAMSLHGMKEDRGGVRTALIISNGARAADPAEATAATRLRLRLEGVLGPPGSVVSCNWPADTGFAYRKLCGTTNVQGRHINGGADACRGGVEAGTGRFIHLEQDPSVLGRFRSGSAVEQDPFAAALVEALAAIIPSTASRALVE